MISILLNQIPILLLSPKYSLNEIYLYNLDFIKELDFKSDTKKLLVYETIIEDDLLKNSYLELYESVLKVKVKAKTQSR